MKTLIVALAVLCLADAAMAAETTWQGTDFLGAHPKFRGEADGAGNIAPSVAPSSIATGGFSKLAVNGLTTTPVTVKGTAGKLSLLYCYNPNVTVAYVQVFDVSGTVTVGTTGSVAFGIAPTSVGGFQSDVGLDFTAAIKVAATTTAAGSTALGVVLDCTAGFK